MFKPKIFLIYFFVILVNDCAFHDAHAACTDLNIFYEKVPADPSETPNWTASVWYTPCKGTKEAGVAFYADKWKDNHLSIESGTRVRIGPQGMPASMDSIDEIMKGDHVDIMCSGTIGTDRSDKNYAKCRTVDSPAPVLACTHVIIDYMPDAHWTASLWYTPCGASEEDHAFARSWKNNSFLIQSGTRVRIGPEMTDTSYVDQIFPDPATGLTHVICYGAMGTPTGGCCVGRVIGDCIDKKKATKPK